MAMRLRQDYFFEIIWDTWEGARKIEVWNVRRHIRGREDAAHFLRPNEVARLALWQVNNLIGEEKRILTLPSVKHINLHSTFKVTLRQTSLALSLLSSSQYTTSIRKDLYIPETHKAQKSSVKCKTSSSLTLKTMPRSRLNIACLWLFLIFLVFSQSIAAPTSDISLSHTQCRLVLALIFFFLSLAESFFLITQFTLERTTDRLSRVATLESKQNSLFTFFHFFRLFRTFNFVSFSQSS